MIGLVCNARGCWPTADDIGALGLRGGVIRSIVYSFDEFDAALRATPQNYRVCALLNSETEGVGGDYSGWRETVKRFALRFAGRVAAVECGNELDIWKVPVATAARIVNEASPLLRAAGMKVITGPVASGDWQGYLSTLAAMTAGNADLAGFHPYGQRANGHPAGWGFEELEGAIRRAHDLSGLPVAVTEYGIKVRDAGSEQSQAVYVTKSGDVFRALPPDVLAFACLFCLGDEMGSPGEQGLDGFGLRHLDGSRRPAWDVFASANGGPVAVPPVVPAPPVEQHARFQMGFAEWAAKDPALLGEPLENERGGVPGFSVQRTSKGRLMACNLIDRGWTLTFWADADGSRWLYNGSHSEQIA